MAGAGHRPGSRGHHGVHGPIIDQKLASRKIRDFESPTLQKTNSPKSNIPRPPKQATGPPRSGAGLGVSMLRDAFILLYISFMFFYFLVLINFCSCICFICTFWVSFYLIWKCRYAVFENLNIPLIYKHNMFRKRFQTCLILFEAFL